MYIGGAKAREKGEQDVVCPQIRPQKPARRARRRGRDEDRLAARGVGRSWWGRANAQIEDMRVARFRRGRMRDRDEARDRRGPWGAQARLETSNRALPRSAEAERRGGRERSGVAAVGGWRAGSRGRSEGRVEVCGAGDLADDVVALAEEGVPVVERALLLVVQVVPFGLHVLGLGGGLGEGARGVVAGEDWAWRLAGLRCCMSGAEGHGDYVKGEGSGRGEEEGKYRCRSRRGGRALCH